MYQQLWGYKVEDKLYLAVREQKRLNTTALERWNKCNELGEKTIVTKNCELLLDAYQFVGIIIIIIIRRRRRRRRKPVTRT
jgi:hypothetical protein